MCKNRQWAPEGTLLGDLVCRMCGNVGFRPPFTKRRKRRSPLDCDLRMRDVESDDESDNAAAAADDDDDDDDDDAAAARARRAAAVAAAAAAAAAA